MKLSEFIALYRLQNPIEAHKTQGEILKGILDRAAIQLPGRVEKNNGLYRIKKGSFNPHLLYDELNSTSDTESN